MPSFSFIYLLHIFFEYQLQEKLKEKIDAELMEKINFGAEMDVFHRLLSSIQISLSIHLCV